MTQDRHPMYRYIEDFLPSFCWQTAFDVMIMLEGLDEDIGYDSVKVALCRMSQGACPRIERRQSSVRGRRRSREPEFLYRFNPAFERKIMPRSRMVKSFPLAASRTGRSDIASPPSSPPCAVKSALQISI